MSVLPFASRSTSQLGGAALGAGRPQTSHAPRPTPVPVPEGVCVCPPLETDDHSPLSPLEGGLPFCAGRHSGLRGAGLPVAGEDPGARGSLRPRADGVRHHRLPRPQGICRQPAGALASEHRGWTLLLAPLTGFTGWAESFRPSAQSHGWPPSLEKRAVERRATGHRGLEPGPQGTSRHLPVPTSPAWLPFQCLQRPGDRKHH